MKLDFSQLNEISTLSITVGGVILTFLQFIFFGNPSRMPVKPEKEFVIEYLLKREKKVLFLHITFTIVLLSLSIYLIEKFDYEVKNFVIELALYLLSVSGLLIVWDDYIIKPLNLRCTRFFLNSISYSEEDFKELISYIDEIDIKSNSISIKQTVYEALGIIIKSNKK